SPSLGDPSLGSPSQPPRGHDGPIPPPTRLLWPQGYGDTPEHPRHVRPPQSATAPQGPGALPRPSPRDHIPPARRMISLWRSSPAPGRRKEVTREHLRV